MKMKKSMKLLYGLAFAILLATTIAFATVRSGDRMAGANGTGRIVVDVETTDESGPVRYSKDNSWSGRIRIAQQNEYELSTKLLDIIEILGTTLTPEQ